MELLYTILVCLVGMFFIHRSPFFASTSLNIKWVQVLFILKVFAGASLGLVYSYYYTDRNTADVFKYFDDGRTIYNVFKINHTDYFRLVTGIGSDAEWLREYLDQTQHWFKPYDHSMYNDNRTIIRFNAIVMLFSGGYFFVHTAIMSFLSFVGTFAIFKFIRNYSTVPLSVLTLTVFLLPSFLFWTSGLLKEGLLIFGLGILVLSADKLIRSGYSMKFSIALMTSIALLSITKYYVLACIAPGLLIFAFSAKFPRKLFVIAITIHAALMVLLIVNSLWPFGIDIVRSLTYKRNDFISFAASLPDVGGLIQMDKVEPGLWPLLKHIPEALYNAFILPLPWSNISVLSMLPLAENLLLACLFIFCLFYPRWVQINKPALIMWLSFTFLLYSLSGLTTPVIGALVRYKTPAMPFLYSGLASFVDWQRTPIRKIITSLDSIISA